MLSCLENSFSKKRQKVKFKLLTIGGSCNIMFVYFLKKTLKRRVNEKVNFREFACGESKY